MSRSLLFRALLGITFSLQSLVSSADQEAIMISPHYSVLETDVQHLIRRLPSLTDRSVFVVYDDPAELDEPLANELLSRGNIITVKRHSREFLSALKRSQVVVTKGRHHLHNYRFFMLRDSRSYLVFDHGLITKAYGRLLPTRRNPSRLSRLKRWIVDWYMYRHLSVQSVSSEVERFFRSSAEGRHPRHFHTYGYPRYDRINEFTRNDATPNLSQNTKELLDDSTTTNILYAPTHKDDAYTTTLFPFDDFDADTLRDFLERHDLRLFIRMHPREANHPQYQNLVDEDHIHSLGVEHAHSSTEILPFIDVLMTDYSSIYMDFLPFDRPIVFVHDRFEKFNEIRGLAFSHDRYFPGRTVETFDSFKAHLQRICETGNDGYDEERAFVTRVLLPNLEQSCLEAILSYLE